ncbi:hypothetical protein C8R44DRAFT_887755 [Mycena epipterygia]|nr:hypothetical protein C8R44DRAFT_887755 [Mycena epipterygia]
MSPHEEEGNSRPSSMALPSQLPEVLDIMASFVPLPSNLLSLALISKALHAFTVPQHLEFREVCCHGRRESLWKALAEHPGPTARILSLALIYEPVSRYQALHSNEQIIAPKSLTTSDVKISPQATSGLSNPNLIGCLRFGWLHDVQAVFTAVLHNCPNLRDLEIAFYDNAPSFDSISDPLWELANLTRVSITVTRAPMVREVLRKYLANAFEMLSRCPQLEALRLASEMRGQSEDLDIF